MMRALLVILLVANVLFFAWSQGAFDRLPGTRNAGEREPERLSRQVHAEQVRVLSASAASAAVAAAAASARAASEAESAASAAAAGTCLEAGPVPAGGIAALEEVARAAGVAAGGWSAVPSERKGLFLIYMGKYADDEALERKREELKRLRIDAQPLRNAQELQPGLVVARFDDKSAAEAELSRLTQRGLRTARVITMRPAVAQLTLRVPAATDAQRDKLVAVKPPAGVAPFAPCAAPVSAGHSASGTVSAAPAPRR